ncbi:hemicentin-1-like [Anopheles nili]|uniref:hemicentin-1-like n=1 Tax=Anopheles nili TaxID=185578 RepID=UPI00237A8DB9|nr:hemicentin-1-like [Anopheles nili]
MMREETFQVDETPHFGTPFFLRKLSDYTVLVGTKAKLSVHISNTKDAKVTWYKDDVPLVESERLVCSSKGQLHSIEIATILPEDNAKWSCQVENLLGKCMCSGQLTVRVPETYKAPEFVDELRAILTSQGTISLECKVIGYPTPELRWFKDSNEIKAGDMFGLTLNGGDLTSLGVYTCVATNCVGKSSSSSKVRVQEQDATSKEKTIDKNSLGEASSTTFLSVNDIKAQLNEEEWLNLLQVNQAPVFKTGLISRDVNIAEPLRLSVVINSVSKPTVNWYKDDLVVENSDNYKLSSDESTYTYHMDVIVTQLDDQGEWKCVASNEFGQAGTSCFVKLIIPKHYRKPKFLENLKAVMLRDGTVNLECKVIGVPQPVLKWYKDGTELKPGDIHRIITGQDGKCCLGTYTCEAVNCMGSVSSTASLHGYDGIADEGPLPPEGAAALVKDASLSTIHEERTSQIFDTAASYESAASNGRGEISFTFDGKEVSVSLYETPELTNDEALQIVQMFADQLHQNINENENVTSLPSLRFVKETSTSGQLVMEALVIDVPVVEDNNLFEDDRRTDFDIDEMHDENTFTFESGIASSKLHALK